MQKISTAFKSWCFHINDEGDIIND